MLEVPATMFRHAVIRAGRCVKELALFGEEFNGVLRLRFIESVRHARGRIPRSLLSVAWSAAFRIGIYLPDGGIWFIHVRQVQDYTGRDCGRQEAGGSDRASPHVYE